MSSQNVYPTAPAPNAKLTGEFINPDDSRWTSLLAEVDHDFYHLPEYVRLEADYAKGRATAFYAEQGEARFLIPLVQNALPSNIDASQEFCDVISPYGYPSPLLHPSGDADQLRRFLKSFQEVGAAQGIVAAFLRLHPLMPLPLEPLAEFGQLVRHGETVYLDLGHSDELATALLSRNHRRDIKKLIRVGYEISLDDWSQFPQFIEIYRVSMQRLGASEMYFFRGDYFPRLKEALGDSLHLAMVMSPNGEVTAGGLFVCTSDIVQYHLAATGDEYYHLSPIKLLVDWMRRWTRDCGGKKLHMGGGVGGQEDSLFRFKSGFSPERTDFFTHRMILDEAKYRELVDQWHKAGGSGQDEGNFFPTYRRPIT